MPPIETCSGLFSEQEQNRNCQSFSPRLFVVSRSIEDTRQEIGFGAAFDIAFVANNLVDEILIGRIQAIQFDGAMVLVDFVRLWTGQLVSEIDVGRQWDV